jgi:membrane dipeptidase
MSDRWFDGHLDLAYLSVCGRDLNRPCIDSSGCVSLPALAGARVHRCFATIFTEPGADATSRGYGYRDSDELDGAEAAGRRQLEIYDRLHREDQIRIVRDVREFDDEGDDAAASPPLSVVILMEGADPIRSVDHVDPWISGGVRIVGLTWATGSRYAGGNARPGPLTAPGRDLVAALDAHRVIHDISHLADQAVDELFQTARGPIIASHSNCRPILDGTNERHLRDDHIREIGRRQGVVGLNLYSPFLTPTGDRATVGDCVRHINHVVELMGHRRGIALGSDMDGGFTPDRLPIGLDHPAKLPSLLHALRKEGWSREEVTDFAWGNWMQLLTRALVHAR